MAGNSNSRQNSIVINPPYRDIVWVDTIEGYASDEIDYLITDDKIAEVVASDGRSVRIRGKRPGKTVLVGDNFGDVIYTQEVIVKPDNRSISTDRRSISLSRGEETSLSAHLSSYFDEEEKQLIWQTNGKEVIRLIPAGETCLVTALKPGLCQVRVCSSFNNSLSADITISIDEPLSIQLDTPFVKAGVGDPVQVKATVCDKRTGQIDASSLVFLRWESSNPEVAGVVTDDRNCTIIPRKVGNCKIKVFGQSHPWIKTT